MPDSLSAAAVAPHSKSAVPLWRLKGGGTCVPAPFAVMAILNVTPDSFYDGGRLQTPEDVRIRALKSVAHGASLLDVGGESTRPYAAPVSEAQELDRVLPALQQCAGLLQTAEGQDGEAAAGSPVPVSIDTYKAGVAAAALEAGASIVNDVSACRFDPGLLDVLTQYKPGYVLMHSLGKPGTMQDEPRYDDVVEEVYAFLAENLDRLTGAGLPEEYVVVDPGIGFGKTLVHNMALLRNLNRFTSLGRPVLLGLSNKSLFGKLLGLSPDDREYATQAATALAAAKGAAIHRVHNPGRAFQTLQIVEAMA